jgi:hypothetical protein
MEIRKSRIQNDAFLENRPTGSGCGPLDVAICHGYFLALLPPPPARRRSTGVTRLTGWR